MVMISHYVGHKNYSITLNYLYCFQKVHRRDRLYSYLATMGLGTPSRRGRLSQNILNNEAVKTFIRRENIIL